MISTKTKGLSFTLTFGKQFHISYRTVILIKFSNNVLNYSTGIIKSVASLSLNNPWSTFNRNNNYVCQMNGSSINESSVFKVWYDSISDVERADVNVLDDVISVRDGYKQCDLSKDEILLTIEIICTN